MGVTGIDRITYGVAEIATCRKFMLDFGLNLVEEAADRLLFETLNGCEVAILAIGDASLPPAFETGSTVREVIWGVDELAEISRIRAALTAYGAVTEREDCIFSADPSGLAVGFRVTRKRPVQVKGMPINTWDRAERIDQPSAFYDRALPVEVGHVVLFTDVLDAACQFYSTLGFKVSDRYPDRGLFMRCNSRGGHHDIFFLKTPELKRGINHVAFTLRDIHEVFGGGLHMSRCAWETQLGPGRHPISSAYFWYFKNPAGGLIEYYSDEDVLTEAWVPRDFEPGPTMFAEWAITGGIDGYSRRQKG